MIVVSDTSPLKYLVLIGHERVLPELFGLVLCPPAVIGELSHPRTPDKVREWAAAPPVWLAVRAPVKVNPALKLGRGEAEAISLAQELEADALLMDERVGQAAAAQLGLFVVGTLGILERAAEKQIIELPGAIDALSRTSFRASPRLLQEVLERDRQRRGPHG